MSSHGYNNILAFIYIIKIKVIECGLRIIIVVGHRTY